MELRTPGILLALLAVVGVQRLWELRRSRANLRATEAGAPRADPTWNWTLMVLVHGGWVLGTAAEVLVRGRVAPAPVWWAGLALFLAAQALRLWCIRTLAADWNARGVVSASMRVVTTGPYRWLRHPNYLAVAVELVALPAAAGAWVTLVLVNVLHAVVLRHRIRGEDALLERVPGYAEAMAQKGGLWPRLRSRRCPAGAAEGERAR